MSNEYWWYSSRAYRHRTICFFQWLKKHSDLNVLVPCSDTMHHMYCHPTFSWIITIYYLHKALLESSNNHIWKRYHSNGRKSCFHTKSSFSTRKFEAIFFIKCSSNILFHSIDRLRIVGIDTSLWITRRSLAVGRVNIGMSAASRRHHFEK